MSNCGSGEGVVIGSTTIGFTTKPSYLAEVDEICVQLSIVAERRQSGKQPHSGHRLHLVAGWRGAALCLMTKRPNSEFGPIPNPQFAEDFV